MAEILASKLNRSIGNVALVLPHRGFSVLDTSGGPLYQPEDDKLFLKTLKEKISSRVILLEVDDNINGDKTAEAVIKCFNEITEKIGSY